MSDDELPVRPWSDVRAERDALVMPPKPTSQYANFREYFDDVILPTLLDETPKVELGYPNLKRRG